MLAHVLIAIFLIIIVLLQRSEGGLGSLGGGGGDALMSTSGSGNVLTRTTKWLFIAFIALSLGLSIMMAGAGGTKSIVETAEPLAAPAVNVPSEVPAEVPANE